MKQSMNEYFFRIELLVFVNLISAAKANSHHSFKLMTKSQHLHLLLLLTVLELYLPDELCCSLT